MFKITEALRDYLIKVFEKDEIDTSLSHHVLNDLHRAKRVEAELAPVNVYAGTINTPYGGDVLKPVKEYEYACVEWSLLGSVSLPEVTKVINARGDMGFLLVSVVVVRDTMLYYFKREKLPKEGI